DYQFSGEDLHTLQEWQLGWSRASPPATEWLRRWLGDEYFQEVTAVHFSGDVTDDQLAVVTELDKLLRFGLSGYRAKKMTDAGLVHVGRVKSLQVIEIFGAPTITDAGLAHLDQLENLQSLALHGTSVTDAGLARVGHMQNVCNLALSDATGKRMSDAGL